MKTEPSNHQNQNQQSNNQQKQKIRDEDLFREYERTKDINIRNKIIERNYPLVTHIVNKYFSSKELYKQKREDLIQEGIMGLMNAIEGFRVDYGYRFSTYSCVPTSTQILTKNIYKPETYGIHSWKYPNEIEIGKDKTLGYDPKDGKTKWTFIKGISIYENAPLVEIGNSQWSTLCTHNHKWLFVNNDKIELKPLSEFINSKEFKLLIAPFEYTDIKQSTPIITCSAKESDQVRDVWCPTTELGTWTARDENGRVFLTGNSHWVKQAIYNYISNIDPMIHIPSHVRTAHNKLIKKLNEYGADLGDVINPDNKDINVDDLGLPLSEKMVNSINNAVQSKNITSIDTPMSSNDGNGNNNESETENASYRELIPNTEDEASQEERADYDALTKIFTKALKSLNKRERNILLLRFNIIDSNQIE